MITGEQVTAARKLLRWSQVKLASKLGMRAKAIVDFETRRSQPPAQIVFAIRRIAERAGVEFTAGGEPSVRLKNTRK
jgi:transcriptional regulator with XRE-family HTH domain